MPFEHEADRRSAAVAAPAQAAIDAASGRPKAKPYRGASDAAIRHHYDVSNDFYELWLDSTRSYSCALWQHRQETLGSAQRRKLDHLALQAKAPGAGRVLDIGCGWGGMIKRLRNVHAVAEVVGLTLSNAQAQALGSWGDTGLEVRVENWAEHRPDGHYDAIVSVEAFEHFADSGLSRAARVDGYRQFFESCASWLKRGSRLVIQTGSKGSNVRLDREMIEGMLFIGERIFPESELPWLSEILQAAERRFEPLVLRNEPEHYVRTLRCWQERLSAAGDRARELASAQVVQDYERYLKVAERAYALGHLGLLRIVFERV